MKTYSSVTASRISHAVPAIVAFLAIVIMILCTVGMWYHFTIVGNIPTILIVLTTFLPGVYSFTRIMRYSKRQVSSLMSPTDKYKIFKMLKALFSRPLELVIIPAYIATILYLYVSLIAIELYTAITFIVVVIYAIQVLPLMIKKEVHIRASKKALNYVRDEIKVSRIILFDSTATSNEKERALRRHMAAEELMSVHSDYLICSTGISGTFIMVVQLITPIITGLGGSLIRPLLGG